MKKRISLMLILVLVFCLTACENPGTKPADLEYEDPEPAVTATPATAEEINYIGNKWSLVFHRLDCWTLPNEENRVPFATREEALSNGYTPCRNCKP